MIFAHNQGLEDIMKHMRPKDSFEIQSHNQKAGIYLLAKRLRVKIRIRKLTVFCVSI